MNETFVKYHDDIAEKQQNLREKGFAAHNTAVYVNPIDRRAMLTSSPEFQITDDVPKVNGAPILESPTLPEGVYAVVHNEFDRYPEAMEIARFSLHEESVYVVKGLGRFPESGEEVVKAFMDEEKADEYAESDAPDRESKQTGGWEIYVVREVPLDG